MTEPPESSTPAAAAQTPQAQRSPEQIAKAERANRLAKALRDNLRRRKAVQPARDKPGN
ncbi:MAG: hypothetical protein KKA16_04560 [Alphaproteobacteria bacterium]|nr:hypothetical protein [Alphaproteobacteria bacterium]MBU2379999.1 hypothetical protein [Alphaproteobacteria bacterium]